MNELAERLLKTIRKQALIKPGDRVAVAVSGGADSVALLSLLLELRSELGIVLSVAHVNHKLRGEESDEDQRFVTALAQRHGLDLHTQEAPLGGGTKSGIEATARKLRYDFFRQLARENRVSKIAIAHTLDDQAETVLLRILRGTGIRGLAGIHPRLVLAEQGRTLGEIFRPLLGFRRAELEAFLREREQPWREDSSNRDLAFLRNRVRHRVLPLLQENFGAASVENLADLAEIARAEEEQWSGVQGDVAGFGMDLGGGTTSLPVEPGLLSFPLAARRRFVRTWLESSSPAIAISFRLIEDILELACGPAGKKLGLPAGYVIRRTRDRLCLEPPGSQVKESEYEYPLQVPGELEIPELGIRMQAAIVDTKSVPEDLRDDLLDPGRLTGELTVRNWRPGDRFWPAHMKDAKKVKELLSDRHIAGAEKRLWPVAVAEGLGLVWVRGFAVRADLQPSAGATRVLWIREAKTK